MNPSDDQVTAKFNATIIGSEMEVFMLSDAFVAKNVTIQAKYTPDNIVMPAKSTAIFTFVPK